MNENDKNEVRIGNIKRKYVEIAKKKVQVKKIKAYYKQKEIKKDIVRHNYIESVNKELQEKNIRQTYDKYIRERPIYKIINNLSSRLRRKLEELNIRRTFKYTEMLGCTIQEFEKHLLGKMEDGMTFDNYGEWEVDHIKAFSSFDFNNLDNIAKCCNYENLRPLWQFDNRSKGDKLL